MAESRGRVCIFTLEAPSCHHEGERGEASFSLGGAGGGLPAAGGGGGGGGAAPGGGGGGGGCPALRVVGGPVKLGRQMWRPEGKDNSGDRVKFL